MKLLLAPALAAILLASLPVLATPLDDRIAELKHAVEKEAASRANGGNNPQFGNPVMNPAFVDASIDQILAQMKNPAYGNMDAQIAQITSMYTSTEVQEATTNLLNEIKKERKDKADAEIAGVKALLTRAGTAITQAKKPEDLDDLIEEMSKHANNQYGGNSALQGDQELVRRLNSAYEFVKQWQNYLAHMANGQTDQARNDLQALSNNNGGEGLLPRSKLLELEAPDKLVAQGVKPAPAVSGPVVQAQSLLDAMKTLDDVKPALARLDPLRQSDMQELQNVYNQLSQIEQNYEDLKAGLPAQSNISYGYNSGGINVPAVIRTQVLLFTLQARFDSYKGPAPAPGEKPTDYIDRVITDATTRQDWNLLRLADAARANLTQNAGMGFSVNNGGVESIVSAAHQEAAGQFSLAVQSYETALKSDDPAIPAKIIGDRLTAIQRDHPKEFADGMQLTINPPAPRYVPGRLPGMPYQPYPYPMPGGVNPLIQAAVPAPTPAPTPTPSPSTNAAPAPAAPPAK
jgi:hypothetical protein